MARYRNHQTPYDWLRLLTLCCSKYSLEQKTLIEQAEHSLLWTSFDLYIKQTVGFLNLWYFNASNFLFLGSQFNAMGLK